MDWVGMFIHYNSEGCVANSRRMKIIGTQSVLTIEKVFFTGDFMLTKIKVTQSLIDAGDRESCTRCPVAMAIAEATNVIPYVDLTGAYLYMSVNPKRDIHLNFPKEVTSKINLYDLTGKMKPFEFDLDIPTMFLKELTDATNQAQKL